MAFKERPCKASFCRGCGKCLKANTDFPTGSRYIPQWTTLMGQYYHLLTASEEEYW